MFIEVFGGVFAVIKCDTISNNEESQNLSIFDMHVAFSKFGQLFIKKVINVLYALYLNLIKKMLRFVNWQLVSKHGESK